MTQRYRVHFIARFDVIVDAPGAPEARSLADQMQHLPWGSWAAAADAHQVSCQWNTIEREDPEDG